MIVLHNKEDKSSREYVAALPSDVQVLDWYNPADRQAWLDAGGTLGISAFPSVLNRHDRYVDDAAVEHEPGWDVIREPPEFAPLPTTGENVPVGIYTYNGNYYICRQEHIRTIYEPEQTPALFSVFRPNDQKQFWIANEPVKIGELREYDGTVYECIQAHTTQIDYPPDVTPNLWKVWTDPNNPQPWVQPTGAHDAYNTGDRVTYNGFIWESTIDANVWAPGVFGWIQV